MLQPCVFTALMVLATTVTSSAIAHPGGSIIYVTAAPVAGAGLASLLLAAGAYAMVRRYRKRRGV
jgi:hypothetical protein